MLCPIDGVSDQLKAAQSVNWRPAAAWRRAVLAAASVCKLETSAKPKLLLQLP